MLSEPKIADHNLIVFHEQIGQFNISMHYFILMKDSKTIHYLHKVVGRFTFTEFSHLFEVLFEITIIAILNDQVIIIWSFHKFEQMHDVGVIDCWHYTHFGLKESVQNWGFRKFFFGHTFYSVNFFGMVYFMTLVDFSELSFTYLLYEQVISHLFLWHRLVWSFIHINYYNL